MTRALRLTLVALTLVLAGCATPSATEDFADLDGTPIGTGGQGTGDTASGGSGESDADAARWYAFAFDRTVTPKSGGAGKIQSFSYTNTQERDGGETIVEVDVTVLGASVEQISTQRYDFASGNYEPDVVSNPLDVNKLRHVMTVVKDDTGHRAAGETTTVTVYVPVEAIPDDATYFWNFVKMEWLDADGETGGWEFYMTPQMRAEMDAGEIVYAPHDVGSSSSWWGFDLLAQTYGLSTFSAFVHGEQAFEEGSFSFGGYSQEVERETMRLGGYTFDGWSVEMRSEYDGSSGVWMLRASADLPMPFAFRYGGSSSGNSDLVSFELTDLRLG